MNELYHHGVKGMKWGVRRYQNPDGSLTAEGKRKRRNLAIVASPGGYALYKGGKAAIMGGKAAGKAIKTKTDSVKETWKEVNSDEYRKKKAMDRSSTAKYVYKNRVLLNDYELNQRINRLSQEKRLKDLSLDDSYGKMAKNLASEGLTKYGLEVAATIFDASGSVPGVSLAKWFKPKKK